MNKMAIIVFFLFTAGARGGGLTAQEIMTKNEEARRLGDVTSHAKLTTGGGGSSERVKEFTWWKKLASDGIHYNTLTRFLSPAEVRNEGILFLERGSSDQTDVQIYLPAYKKIRRVESQQQSGSFMGSEFSYSDISTPHTSDYNYKLLREEGCPSANTPKCFVIECIPATNAIRDRMGFSKATIWIRQDNFMEVKSEYSDLDGKPWKHMAATDIKEVDPQGHKWMIHHIRMENSKTGHYTDLQMDQVKVNQKISDSIFTPQNLAREK